MSKLVSSACMDGDSLSMAYRLRRMFHAEGQLPGGILPVRIEASWQRSLAHGVDCFQREPCPPRLASDPQVLLTQHAALWDVARPELNRLLHQHGRERLLILADAQAQILSVQGCTDRMAHLGIANLLPGTCSSESLCGTNALGTAVVDRAPVLINAGEHYLASLNRISCAAVPVHDEQGRLLAVLDITQEGPLDDPEGLLADLGNAATRMEARWLVRHFPEDRVFAFHRYRSCLSTHWRGLLVVGRDGAVRTANGAALALLNLRREQLPELDAGAVFGHSWTVLNRLREGEVLPCEATAPGFFVHALHVPAQALALTGKRQPYRRPALSFGEGRLPPGIAGGSPDMVRALGRALRGLDREVPVLLLGETGTGKEVTARALHEASARGSKPFVAINCAAMPEGLIESELFGYVSGAFTGARRGGSPGRLMQADGGTLFLDEIGDMPLALQTRLLRVLQERRVVPLGGGEERSLDIALICATHRDLRAMVRHGSFREDLFYRIDGFSVRLPPLRERTDLPALVAVLLDKLGAPGLRVHPDLMRLFGLYAWPGNVRQLEMVLRTALAVREDDEDEIAMWHLGVTLQEDLQRAAMAEAALVDTPSGQDAPDAGLADAAGGGVCGGEDGGKASEMLCIREHEQALIRAALHRHQGNVRAAAQSLGIGRATLYRKLQRQGEAGPRS